MNEEAQALRMGIRDGLIVCRCPRPALVNGYDYHQYDCQWNAAMRRIYELERAEDAKR